MVRYCIVTKNHEGIKVIFTESQRKKKCLKRPELRTDDFIKRVRQTIENFVITAYRPDYVKERGKTKLIYGKDYD